MADFFHSQFLHKHYEADFESRVVFNHKILRYELQKHDKIIIPALQEQISGSELADWLIENSSPQDIDTLVLMIQKARKHNSDTKATIEMIVSALTMDTLTYKKEAL
ncbi:hypothetical protein [Cytobacillus gottheilii]|uniref:hypothetical protein n=1 Tax=Cytobacillus gottheilii TaxID=859144 RepID=UPI00082ADA7D|nr:hypothetical protein [Cytobacillus gottheilii]